MKSHDTLFAVSLVFPLAVSAGRFLFAALRVAESADPLLSESVSSLSLWK